MTIWDLVVKISQKQKEMSIFSHLCINEQEKNSAWTVKAHFFKKLCKQGLETCLVLTLL
jgi:hypothetical protein